MFGLIFKVMGYAANAFLHTEGTEGTGAHGLWHREYL